ncbi:MAG: radical SAM protein, partial [Nitrospiraceae bacterium]|nr:radical SAM protein [Nitrospiraceae bacterium]
MPISREQEFFIQWHLTERCNLRCSHCYQTGGRSDELELSEINDVVSEVSGMLRAWTAEYGIPFSPSFNITGGEPLLRQDLFAVLDAVRASGFDTFLLTNGTLITAEKAKQLAALAVKGVQVSIEGPEMVHDSIRGKGSFAASLKGIRHLLDAGLPVTINATLSEINAARFPDMVELAVSLGVQRLGFSRLVPSGRGR